MDRLCHSCCWTRRPTPTGRSSFADCATCMPKSASIATNVKSILNGLHLIYSIESYMTLHFTLLFPYASWTFKPVPSHHTIANTHGSPLHYPNSRRHPEDPPGIDSFWRSLLRLSSLTTVVYSQAISSSEPDEVCQLLPH